MILSGWRLHFRSDLRNQQSKTFSSTITTVSGSPSAFTANRSAPGSIPARMPARGRPFQIMHSSVRCLSVSYLSAPYSPSEFIGHMTQDGFSVRATPLFPTEWLIVIPLLLPHTEKWNTPPQYPTSQTTLPEAPTVSRQWSLWTDRLSTNPYKIWTCNESVLLQLQHFYFKWKFFDKKIRDHRWSHSAIAIWSWSKMREDFHKRLTPLKTADIICVRLTVSRSLRI